MRLSPHQVRTVLEIKEQTLRYWKQAYPQLAGRRGYGPCYSFGEVLVLLITKQLVENFGVEVTKLRPVSEALFNVCSASVSLLSDPNRQVSIDVESMAISIVNNQRPPTGQISLVLSLHDLAQELQRRILVCIGDEETAQLALALGPTALPEKMKQMAG